MTGKEIQIIKYLQLQIKIAMKDMRLTQENLAKKAKISRSQVQNILDSVKGLEYQYTFSTLMKICLALEILNIRFDENEITNIYLRYER